MSTAEFNAIVEDFEFIDDWEDRYRYIIEKGKKMPFLDDALKVEATKVHGCASQVWMHPTIENDTFYFDGDSDAIIVRGLISLLKRLAHPSTFVASTFKASSRKGIFFPFSIMYR